MRDKADNQVIICSIENLDPMGVHTGDSITVAPVQTLTDVEYQEMRDERLRLHPSGRGRDRRLERPVRGRVPRPAVRLVIEMNPRVSPQLGPGLEGHRLPDRQDRSEASPSATRSTRSPTTSPKQDAGQLRAVDRLRRHQDPALGVREVPGDLGRPRHVDAVGRRGDGHRSHLPRVAAEGAVAALEQGSDSTRPRRDVASTICDRPRSCSRLRSRSAHPIVIFQLEACCGAAVGRGRQRRLGKVDPWFLDQMLR